MSESYFFQGVGIISEFPMDGKKVITYQCKIGDTEMTVENIIPAFRTEADRNKTKASIMQCLYEIFSKYRDTP